VEIAMQTPVDPYLNHLAELCRKYRIRKLELFGSAAQGKFDPEKSDLDFLVEYDRSEGVDILEQYFGFQESLEKFFKRKVDVIQEKNITNPYFREGVNRARKLLYAA
jgi:predicted nucleotidyltransferase